MSNKLVTIQKISKVLYILSKIVFIFMIVGTVCCLIGCFSAKALFAPEFAEIMQEAGINDILAEEGIDFEITENFVLAVCIDATISCGAVAVLYWFVKKFYKHELETGTPFDADLSKELKTLGILYIVIPLVSSIVCSIIASSLHVEQTELDFSIDITMGIVYLILSVICGYGAEIKANKDESFENPFENN